MALPAFLVIPIGIGLRYVAKRVATAVIARAGTAAGTAARTGAQAGRVGGVLGDIAVDGDIGDIEHTGDVIGSGSQSRDEASDDARPTSGEISDADADECSDTDEDCNDCGPRGGKKEVPLNRNVNTGGGDWVTYQLKIANVGGDPVFGLIDEKPEEWIYNNVDFDGFWSSSCTLVEGKSGYESWLEYDKRGKLRPKQLPFMMKFGGDFINQATFQQRAIFPDIPQAKLIWFFSSETTKAYIESIFQRQGLAIPCQYVPL